MPRRNREPRNHRMLGSQNCDLRRRPGSDGIWVRKECAWPPARALIPRVVPSDAKRGFDVYSAPVAYQQHRLTAQVIFDMRLNLVTKPPLLLAVVVGSSAFAPIPSGSRVSSIPSGSSCQPSPQRALPRPLYAKPTPPGPREGEREEDIPDDFGEIQQRVQRILVPSCRTAVLQNDATPCCCVDAEGAVLVVSDSNTEYKFNTNYTSKYQVSAMIVLSRAA